MAVGSGLVKWDVCDPEKTANFIRALLNSEEQCENQGYKHKKFYDNK